MTRAPCRRRTGEALPRAEKFDLITGDHKVLSEEGESRNNHRNAVVEQDLATQWIQSYPCEKLHMRRRKAYENSRSRRKHRKVYVQTIRWNLEEHVKFYHGITALQHLIDTRQMASLKEPSDE